MTYSESAAGITITKQRAFQELKAHGICHADDFDLFLKECGDRPEYRASDVLAWLGY